MGQFSDITWISALTGSQPPGNLRLARRGHSGLGTEITSKVQGPGELLRAFCCARVPCVSKMPPVPYSQRLDLLEAAVRARTDVVPQVGIVLGSGLGGLGDALTDSVAIPFSELPGWPAASAPGHAGRLLLGKLDGVPVVCLQGRLHLYEGHSERLVVEPVLLMGRLGARTIVLTNAAGGVNVSYPAGTLMLITDHLNLTGRSPLMGPNDDSIGPRFPDLVDAWSPRLRAVMRQAAADTGIALEEGVYAGLTGPTYETPAEVRHAAHSRRRQCRHVNRPGGHRGPLGGPRRGRGLAGDKSRCRRHRRASEPRGGPRRRRRGRPLASCL